MVYHTVLPPNINRNDTFVGKLITLAPWQEPSMINLSTGDKKWSFRILRIENIVSCRTGNNKPEKVLKPKVTKDKSWQVASSTKGKFYTVTEVQGRRTCTCPGFQFRHSCKHLKEAK